MVKKTILITLGAITTLAGGGFVINQEIDPYTDKDTKLELVATSKIPNAGQIKTEFSKIEPDISLSKWNGEATMGVKYQNVKGSGSVKLFTDVVEWKDTTSTEEVNAYPIKSLEVGEDGGVEMEVILKDKPSTNIFSFVISGTENLDFFYQPELTKEEINEGVKRPENVVGSYAVYYKNHSNHIQGKTNYATGKAYHIYRPKAVDADGNWIWGELNYDNGILYVTVPQKFLDTAVYPVKVDPTFGYNTVGGSTTGFTNAGNALCNLVTTYIASTGDTITGFSAHGNTGTSPANLASAIYSVVSGNPSSRLDTKVDVVIPVSAGWATTTVSQTPTAGVQYCMAVSGEDLGILTANMNFDTGTAPGRIRSSLTTLQPSFSPSGTDTGTHYSWYATYTQSGGGATASTSDINNFLLFN